MPEYSYLGGNGFQIKGFRQAPPFTSFLPGIAGLQGTPMWVYYVNRGQCVCSFGVQDKDHAILPFSPADQAYAETGLFGFRTFFRQNGAVREPFSGSGAISAQERMQIEPDRLCLESMDSETGLRVKVVYFTVPNEAYAALCRKVTIENTTRQKAECEVLDGLARLVPYGIGHIAYKTMSNTLSAWMDVFNLENGVPFFRVRASVEDSETSEQITGGYFCLSTVDGQKVCPVVDPRLIFGQNTSFLFPDAFGEQPLDVLLSRPQHPAGRIPCAFTPAHVVLASGESFSIRTMFGYLDDMEYLPGVQKRVCVPGYFEEKQEENTRLVEDLFRPVTARTGEPRFDAYLRQCYLDNMLRGGKPVFFDSETGRHVYYVYSRKHGDPERDYNDFRLEAGPYSQGNGNFRDVCQNRRSEILLFPETGDYNIRLFAELIQADGYNPLVVNGSVFRVPSEKLDPVLQDSGISGQAEEKIREKLAGAFSPGPLFRELRRLAPRQAQNLFQKILYHSVQETSASFGEGYWTDHWTYLLDLVENYLAVFPERCKELLFGKSDYRYFQSGARVVPRKEKYVLRQGRLRQINAVVKTGRPDGWMTTADGKLFQTDLFTKLFTLALIKYATLDPAGIGIEMEAGKPGWNDSLNGLPSLFGSSVAETAELKRLTGFLRAQYDGRELCLADEVYALFSAVERAENEEPYEFWLLAGEARETYRAGIEQGFTGVKTVCPPEEIRLFFERMARRLDSALQRAMKLSGGICPACLYYRPVFSGNPREGEIPPRFEPVVPPHFLEGPAHLLKIMPEAKAREMARAVKKSDLFDEKLHLYKISGPLDALPYEAGRARAFVPGILENESVFLHMEYKYLLGLLRAGLYPEFLKALRETLIPFQPAERYGRSTLENCSFLASSANPNPEQHGRGFVARLSGSTAEMLDIWCEITAGTHPFTVEDNALTLRFSPVLPEWLFDEAGTLSFTFLGCVNVRYHYLLHRALICNSACTYRFVAAREKNGAAMFEKASDCLRGEYALAVRNGRVKYLDVYFQDNDRNSV
jgi:hypothetical protein